MIEANELRIGNWILDSETDEQYFQVEEIRKYVGNENWVYYRKGSIKAKEVESVPLTEEILLNCGFEKKGLEVQYQILICDETETENIKLLILESCDEAGYFADIHEKIYMGSYTMNISKVKYLHQLQNLYWCLCGKELTIKL